MMMPDSTGAGDGTRSKRRAKSVAAAAVSFADVTVSNNRRLKNRKEKNGTTTAVIPGVKVSQAFSENSYESSHHRLHLMRYLVILMMFWIECFVIMLIKDSSAEDEVYVETCELLLYNPSLLHISLLEPNIQPQLFQSKMVWTALKH